MNTPFVPSLDTPVFSGVSEGTRGQRNTSPGRADDIARWHYFSNPSKTWHETQVGVSVETNPKSVRSQPFRAE